MGAVLLCSCGGKSVLDEERTFANATWNFFTPEVFEFDITNPDDYFNITLEVMLDSALMRNDQLPLTVNLYNEDNERRMFYAYINLVENGRWKGEPLKGRDREGLRLMSQRVREFFLFNSSGHYRMEVGQVTSQYDLEGIESLRVKIEKAKIDYKDLKD